MSSKYFVRIYYLANLVFIRNKIFLCLAIMQIWNISCLTINPIDHEKSKDSIKEVILLIEDCPAWSDISSGDKDSFQRIYMNFEKISKSDIEVTREAIKLFIRDRQRAKKYYVKDMSQVFLLNRYLLNVPSAMVSQKTVARYGGWVGIPIDSENINLLWPFSLNRDGSLQIVGKYNGYIGDDYMGLDEFDDFKERFGLRKTNK